MNCTETKEFQSSGAPVAYDAIGIGHAMLFIHGHQSRGTTVELGLIARLGLNRETSQRESSALLGCDIGRCSYIATAATVLQGAILRPGASIGVGAFVHAKTVIPEQFFVPPNSIAIGDPVEIYRPGDPELVAAIKSIGFSRVAFGINESWEDRIRRYQGATEVRSREYESHFQDEILGE